MKFLQKLLFKWRLKGRRDYINGSEILPPPLSSKDEAYYLLEYQKSQSLEARNVLIEHNLRLVIYVAKRYDNNISNLEDLISIGTLGLIKAIATFKCDKNIKLATYASRCIENEILMSLRKRVRLKKEISLDEPLNNDSDGNELVLLDVISNGEEEVGETLDLEEQKRMIYQIIGELKPREKEILVMRFGLYETEEFTQKETADKLGISQSYISRLEKRIIKKLRTSLIN